MTDKDIEVIVKPIFTKMFKANFSACEYGIECYKKGMEYQGIKELATENDNLIKQVEKLEKENSSLKQNKETVAHLGNTCIEVAKQMLEEAVELLKEWIVCHGGTKEFHSALQDKTEDFLKEV